MNITRSAAAPAILLALAAACADPPAARAGALATEYLEAHHARYPESNAANLDGLFDNTSAAYQAWDSTEAGFLRRVEQIVPELDPASPEALTLGLLRERLEMSRQFRICRRELWNVGPLTGWLNEYRGVAARPVADSDSAREAARRRWSRLPAFIDTEIANLRAGLAAGRSAPRPLVTAAIAQADQALADPPNESPFFAPAARDSSPAFRQAFERLVRDSITPALRRYRDFLAAEYQPRARTTAGIGALPDGEACFRALIRRYTSLDLAPAQLGGMGRGLLAAADPAALQRRQRELIADPANRFGNSAEALDAMRDALRRAAETVPRWFGRLPAVLVPVVDSMPDAGPADPDALYEPGSGGAPRVYVNLPRLLEPGGRMYAERLAFHEGVPGHHFQIALAQSADAHPLNRALSNPAFGEGWAVYASNLADEMGLYSSDASRFPGSASAVQDGLTFVVQQGIHALGWTRSQAIDTLRRYSGGGADEAAQQVDYFIAAPAHALGYPLGAQYLEELRRDASRRLGPRFDVKVFHDVVLGSGALPLSVLKGLLDRWVLSQRDPGA